MIYQSDEDIFIPTATDKRRKVLSDFTEKKIGRDFKDGTIKKLILTNFMVHQKLELNFEPRINIITGPNGSGKSAILQAIVLALGASVKDSKRGGTSLTQYIRQGATKAEIQLTLYNGGPEAYKFEIFGPELILERVLNRQGGNTHAVRSGDNTIKMQAAKAAQEREIILNHFNIEPTNPMSILQQEEAKVFFQATDERKLYEIFEKGTLIKYAQDYQQLSKLDLERCQAALELKEKHLSEISEIAKNLSEEEAKLLKSDYSTKIKELTVNIKWGREKNSKRKFEKQEAEAEKLVCRLAELRQREEELTEKKLELDLKNLEVNASNADTLCDIELKIKSRDAADTELQNVSAKKAVVEKRIKDLDLEVNRNAKQIQSYRNDARRLKLSQNNNHTEEMTAEQRHIMFQEKIDAKNEEIKAINLRMSITEAKQTENQDLETDLIQQKYELSSLQVQLENRMKGLELKCKNGNDRRSNEIHQFGRKLADLSEAIASQANRFTKPVVGPVAHYVRLSGKAADDDDLGKVIEAELGRGLLQSFIVNHKRDYDSLQEILRFHSMNWVTVYVRPFTGQKYNVNQFRVSGHPGMLDYLQVNNSEVFNLLVDSKKIESVLVLDRSTAEYLFSRKERVPANATKIITPDFYQYYPPVNGNYSSYYMKGFDSNYSPLLVARQQSSVDRLKKEKKDIGKEQRETEAKVDRLKNKLKGLAEDKKRYKDDISKLNDKLDKTREEISKLKIEQQNEADGLENLQTKIADLEFIQESKRDLLNLAKIERGELSREVATRLKIVGDIAFEIESLNKKLVRKEDLELQLKHQAIELGRVSSEKKKKEKELAKLNDDIVDQKRMHASDFKDAMLASDDVEIMENFTVHEVSAMQKALKKAEKENLAKDGSDLLEVGQRKNEALLKEMSMEHDINSLKRNIAEITNMMEERKARFFYLRTSLTRICKRAFADLLQANGLHGSLEISRETKTLSLKIDPSGDKEDSETAQISLATLSGGERSKTLVCLIMALWNQMSCPFRCLDEWDVFLDDKARGSIEKVLVHGARKRDHQYIFISPQSSEFKNKGKKDVNVIEIEKRK